MLVCGALKALSFEKMQIFQEDQKTTSALIKLLVGIFLNSDLQFKLFKLNMK